MNMICVLYKEQKLHWNLNLILIQWWVSMDVVQADDKKIKIVCLYIYYEFDMSYLRGSYYISVAIVNRFKNFIPAKYHSMYEHYFQTNGSSQSEMHDKAGFSWGATMRYMEGSVLFCRRQSL